LNGIFCACLSKKSIKQDFRVLFVGFYQKNRSPLEAKQRVEAFFVKKNFQKNSCFFLKKTSCSHLEPPLWVCLRQQALHVGFIGQGKKRDSTERLGRSAILRSEKGGTRQDPRRAAPLQNTSEANYAADVVLPLKISLSHLSPLSQYGQNTRCHHWRTRLGAGHQTDQF
jgi:hypothetical protein